MKLIIQLPVNQDSLEAMVLVVKEVKEEVEVVVATGVQVVVSIDYLYSDSLYRD
jgi:hypothetical protein